MNWQWTPYSLPLAAMVSFTVALAAYAFPRRRQPGAAVLLLFLAAATIYILTYLLEISAVPLEAKVFWLKARIVGVVLIPVSSLALVLHTIGQSYRLTYRLLALLAIHPMVTLALAWTEPAHHLMWQELRVAAAGAIAMLEMIPGPAFILHNGYVYLFSLFALWWAARFILALPGISRRQAAILMLSIISPAVGSALTVTGLNPLAPLRLEPFTLPVAALGWTWAVFRYQLFGVVPIARGQVVETIEDAVIVLDVRHRVSDLNRAARELFRNPNAIGQMAAQAFAHYPQLSVLLIQPVAAPLTLRIDGVERHYDVRTTPLRDRRNHALGWLTTLRDVTQRERAARIQAATYHISQAVVATQSLPELFRSIHTTLGALMPAQNFFIALYNAAADEISFPYYVDEHDAPPPPQKAGRGLTEYIIRTRQTQLIHPDDFERLVQAGEVEEVGAPSLDWLGVPLMVQDRLIGVLAVQSYTEGVRYGETERDILTFVSNQVSLAIERKQAEADLQTRDRMLTGVAQAAAHLLSPAPFSETIQRALEALGRAADADRAYIFENSVGPLTHAPLMTQRYEWARATVSPQIDNPTLQGTPYTPHLYEMLTRGPVTSLMPDFPAESRASMESQDILSLLLVPIVIEDRFWGFIGFDDCQTLRVWSALEIALLAAAAANFGSAFVRRQIEVALRDNERYLAMLNTITQSALQTLNLTEMLNSLARQMTELFRAEGCYLALWEAGLQHLRPAAAYGPRQADFLALPQGAEYDQFAKHLLDRRQPATTGASSAQAVAVPSHLVTLFQPWDFLFLPLIAGEARLGIMALAFAEPHTFTPDEITRGDQAAGQIALALAKISALDLAQRRAQEAETLRQAGAAVASTLRQDEAIERILEQLEKVVPYDTASVQLLRDDHVETVGGRGWPYLSDVIGLRFPVPGDPLSTIVIQQRQPFIVPDILDSPYHDSLHETARHIRSWLGVPLIAQDRVVGMLSLDSIQPDYFTPDHVRLSAAFADQVAVAIENARLYHSLQQNASELATLYRASEQLFGSSQDVTELANRIVQAITREFTDAYCGLRLVDESGNYLGGLVEAGTLLSATAPRPAVPLEGPGLLAAAARSGDVIYAPDVRQDPRYLPSHSNTRSELVVPLRVKSRVIGVLNLESARVDGFDERSRRLIAAFAERAALALENAQLLARLEVARQAAQEASRLKSEFLTNTSHELRTPLTGILGSLDLVIDEMCASPEEERQFLKIARQAGRQLLEMINLLLDLSRIESGKVEVKSAVVDISPLLIEVYLLLQGQAQERHLHLDLHLPAEPFTKVWADPDKVRQIMLNLIGNALKFTEQGQIRVSADADRLEGLMRVDVQDTGIGIPPEQQARLFQPFVQLDGSSTRKYGGTGLGLNIARRLAQMMDGNITLYSAGENQGSTFTLSLPLVQDEQT